MHPLTGYTDRWSAKPGDTVRFMVASAESRPFRLRFVRHICADPNPDGPGYHEIPMPTKLDGEHAGSARSAFPGSFGHVPALSLSPEGGLVLSATIWPTTPRKGQQGVVSVALNGWQFSLGIGRRGGAMAELRGPDGTVASCETGKRLLERRWYGIAASIDGAGRLLVVQRPHQPLGDAAEATAQGAKLPAGGIASVWLAALPPVDAAPASALFNGKLECPALWRGADLPERPAQGGESRLLAAWDFSLNIPTQTATDIGPQAAHARLVNLPTRAMTGSNWTGAVHDWKADPAQYGAIHFHDDDIGDLGWPESFALTIPETWPSGFYAAHIAGAHGEDYIPFFVRPAQPQADVALLVPTFSYQVYGCYVRPGRGAEIADRAAAWGALPETPDINRQFGLSAYNHHSDGSGVSITSQLRPMLDTRPRQISLMDPAEGGSGTGRIAADSYIVQWLTTLGQAHDIITDHDLHAEGVAALAPYRVVIAGQHPEYHSERMMQALEAHLDGGGRLMYLGGNGFYWRAEPSESAPDAIEVRRAEGGIRVWETMPGESYHAFGGGYGGLWRRIGRSGHRLTGISFSTQGRHLGFPYAFTEGINDSRAAFMMDGLNVGPGMAFGDAGYMGGGAAGFELDSVNAKYGTPPHALVVAKGVVIHPDYAWVNEDMLTHRHPLPQQDWSCADMTFFETPSGGAVFSVGSMTYAGSLPVAAGQSVLGKLTANVLRRFLDPAPFALPAGLADPL
jgi:N,N-dimethylformamidase